VSYKGPRTLALLGCLLAGSVACTVICVGSTVFRITLENPIPPMMVGVVLAAIFGFVYARVGRRPVLGVVLVGSALVGTLTGVVIASTPVVAFTAIRAFNFAVLVLTRGQSLGAALFSMALLFVGLAVDVLRHTLLPTTVVSALGGLVGGGLAGLLEAEPVDEEDDDPSAKDT
jgi:hypothetical protein